MHMNIIMILPSLSLDTSVIDGVMQSIGGTSSLVLIPVVVLLIIITTVLCGVVICLRNKTKQVSDNTMNNCTHYTMTKC